MTIVAGSIPEGLVDYLKNLKITKSLEFVPFRIHAGVQIKERNPLEQHNAKIKKRKERVQCN